MLTIDGEIISGLGAASGCMAAQLPIIAQSFPQFKNFHAGTINVLLEAQLEVIKPDYITAPIQWSSKGAAEMFGFLQVTFEVTNVITEQNAWIYIPHLSPHRKNPFYAEIILPSRANLMGRKDCKIHFPPRKAKIIV